MGMLKVTLLVLMMSMNVFGQNSNPDELKVQEAIGRIIESLKATDRYNGPNLSKEIGQKLLKTSSLPEKRKEEILRNISRIDVKKQSPQEITQGLGKLISNVTHEKVGICLKEEERCGGTTQSCCQGLTCSKVTSSKEKKSSYKCLRALKVGEACVPYQSLCEKGFCGSVDVNSTNLGICAEVGKSCSSSSECCSKSCRSGKCERNFQCQHCINPGQKVKANEKCCEGYYPDLNGTCISDYPPAQPVTSISRKSILQIIFNLLIPSAEADTAVNPYADFKTCSFDSKKSYYYVQLDDDQRKAVDWARAFEFMATGDGVDDFWKDTAGKSIYSRAKDAAADLKRSRLEFEAKLVEMDEFMKCTCIAQKGFDDPSVTQAQKDYFSQSGKCDPSTLKVSKKKTESINGEDLDQGSSGLKYQQMLVQFYSKSGQIKSSMMSQYTNSNSKLQAIHTYLLAQNWTGKKTTWKNWSESRDIGYLEWLFDVMFSICGGIIGAFEWAFSGGNSQEIWHWVGELWNRNPNQAYCNEVDTDYHATYYTDEFDCHQEIFIANEICGKNIFNALCMKVLAERSDSSGLLSSNKYIIDPLVPKDMNYTKDASYTNGFDQNSNPVNSSYSAPAFSDTNKQDLINLASAYAKTQGFYATDAESDSFGSYVFEHHFLEPYSSDKGAYPAPGLAPYYQTGMDSVQKISVSFYMDGLEDLNKATFYGDKYLATLDLYKDNSYGHVEPGTKEHDILQATTFMKHQLTLLKAAFDNQSLKVGNGLSFNGKLGKNPYVSESAFVGAASAANAMAAYNKKQKEKFDNWMKHVGNTDKGKDLLAQKAARDRSAGVGAGGAGGMAGSGSGNGSSSGNNLSNAVGSFQNELDAVGKANAATKIGAESRSNGSGLGGGKKGSGLGLDGSAYSTSPSSETPAALSNEEQDNIMANYERNKSEYAPNEEDTLFKVVSKAYVRSLDKVLKKKKQIEE